MMTTFDKISKHRWVPYVFPIAFSLKHALPRHLIFGSGCLSALYFTADTFKTFPKGVNPDYVVEQRVKKNLLSTIAWPFISVLGIKKLFSLHAYLRMSQTPLLWADVGLFDFSTISTHVLPLALLMPVLPTVGDKIIDKFADIEPF